MEIDNIEIWRVSGDRRRREQDSVIHEAEVVLRLDGRVNRRFLCLPDLLEELALGYLASQGLVVTPDMQIERVANEVSVYRGGKVARARPKRATSQLKIAESEVFDYIRRLDESSLLFKKTGGTHVVGLFNGSHALFVEDISRHCAIDKVIGLAMKNKTDLRQSVLVTSCRQTLSTMKKAINTQIPIVITISAPTDLAIEKAHLFGITLVGFARGQKFNIYSHDLRITPSPGQTPYPATPSISAFG